MAKYNTFVVCESKSGRVVLVTSSARKARGDLQVGRRIEIWNENKRRDSLTWKTRHKIIGYVQAEKEYIGMKQTSAEVRNSVRTITKA